MVDIFIVPFPIGNGSIMVDSGIGVGGTTNLVL